MNPARHEVAADVRSTTPSVADALFTNRQRHKGEESKLQKTASYDDASLRE